MAPGKGDRRGRVELKRDFTNRGTAGETTKTTLRLSVETKGLISQLRLDLPFPDAQTDFEGDITEPHLGDIKLRATFRTFPLAGAPVTSFLEATFPTADPKDLGSGKYQVSAGFRSAIPFRLWDTLPASHRLTFRPFLQQILSVAGDPDFKDINYTKLDLAVRDTWRKTYWFIAKVKPVVDWRQNAATGATGEVEFGGFLSRIFSAWVTAGARLWGSSVPSTYDHRVSAALAADF